MLPETNLPWWRHDRPWGFRFSIQDGVIFLGGLIATVVAWPYAGVFSLCVPFLLGHFFLFCNTFRIGGERTLIWAATFILNVFLWIFTQAGIAHLAAQCVITAGLIANCVFGKNYHGFACTRINPNGYRDGALAEGAFTRRVLLACRIPKPVVEILIGRKLDEFG